MGKNSIKTNWGISLSLLGVPLGMYANHLYPIAVWSPIFMFVSVALIISFKNLFSLRFPSYNKVFGYLLFFQFLMLLYGFASDDKMDSKLFSFHLYIISLILAYSSLSTRHDFSNIVVDTFYLSTVCTFLGALFMYLGFVVGDDSYYLRQSSQYYLEPFTVANGALINAIAGICVYKKNKLLKVVFFICLLLDIYILLSSTKRTPVFIFIISVIVFLYKKELLNWRFNSRMLKTFSILFLAGIISYTQISFFANKINVFFTNFYTGVLNLFGDTSVTDATGSAIMRTQFRNEIFNYVDNNFNIVNYVLGGGYMLAWIDSPLIQSYIDMGFLGFILFVALLVIYPLKSLRIKSSNPVFLFTVLITLPNILNLLSAGHLYMYSLYLPICLLAIIIPSLNREKDIYPKT